MDWPSKLDQIKIILTWFNFIPELRKKSYQKVFFPINLIIFPLNFILKLFYGLVILLLNWLSWLDHVMVIPTQFNFKPSSSKILGYEGYFMPVSSSLSFNFIFKLIFTGMTRCFFTNQVDLVMSGPTWFNFKPRLCKELDQNISKLTW